MASSCSCSSSSSGRSYSYDVFLNFRGEDTRKIFVGHLHKALKARGLNTFIDSPDVGKGSDLSVLLKAIRESRISIVVFSQSYASSTWCLKELVQILKCVDMQKQIVVPIFYQVDPSHVRKLKTSFAQAFAKHESDSKTAADIEEVQTWKSSLNRATHISGWDSRDYKDDAKLIDEIVDHVFKEWMQISSSKNNNLVGMNFHLHKMRQLLRLEKDDVVVKVGIWGMGGIGKTTIAMEVYDEIRCQFDHCYFFPNVKEGFGNPVRMQEQLLSGILKTQVKIDTLNEGYKMMERLSMKKVIVVLDDVDNAEQIETLFGNEPSFGGGSRIIVTTRDSSILNEFERYEAKLLSDGDALTLFNQYAFKRNKPSREYDHLSSRAVEYAQSLPLALKILGAFLHNRSASEWEDELEKLKIFPNSRIQKVLGTSYDGLDDLQKKIFLDVACFFKGMDVTNVLYSCDGFYPRTGLKDLVDRALVTITESGKLEMHDLLQELGRGIVRSESKEPGKRSRLWSYGDVERVLNENTATEAIEGLMIDLPNSKEIYIEAEAFVRMTELRLLIFTYHNIHILPRSGKYHVNGDIRYLSRELRVLVWHKCPLKSLPLNFHPENLVELDMCYSDLERLWQGIKPLKKLIRINLCDCQYLNTIPDLTEATNLEELDLEGCIGLREVHPSIAGLTNLVFLSLKRCSELKSLPSSVHLKSLKTLILSGCSNFDKFPEISETMEALLEINLDETAIEELPSSIERLQRLKSLSMENCTSLVCLPDSICSLAELRFLNLEGCSKLHNLPENFGSLKSLLGLQVNKSGLKQLPVSILRLKLGRLLFYHCKQMVAPLSSWPSSIEGRFTVVVHLDFTDCNLRELSDAIAHFSSLKILKLSRTNLESLPATMNQLVFLVRLQVDGCKRLKSVPELSSSISNIYAHDCTALETVSTPKSPYDMGRCFTFSNCSQLVQNDLFRDIVDTHSPPQGNYSQPFYMCLPGSEIPERFIHQCRGSSVTAQLPPNWIDKKFLGFAICAVIFMPRYTPVQCFCTFKGNHCEYRFSFYLFHEKYKIRSVRWVGSNHMVLGYVPWSEFGINGEEVNERCYTEAKFEIHRSRFDPSIKSCDPCILRCGVQFFFANNEEVVHRKIQVNFEGCSAEPSGSAITSDTSHDEDEQYLKLAELFEGANRNSRENFKRDESDCEFEDNYSSETRKILSTWTQQIRVTSGLMQGPLDDGLSWNCWEWTPEIGLRSIYNCTHRTSCRAMGKLRISVNDPTILKIKYIGRHTCWKTLPMLTHQVRVTPDIALEGPFDGFSWGKYGQMDLRGAKYPRVCFVCTPQNVRGCMAIKEVQCSNDDPTILKITYRGRHTCIQAYAISNLGRGDCRIFEGGGALRINDQVVQSPRSLGDNGSGGNVIRLADGAMDDNNVNGDANSQDMEHSQDVNHRQIRTWWVIPISGVVSEGTSEAVVNQKRVSLRKRTLRTLRDLFTSIASWKKK